jgi:chemotaxis regulatin CheY-phosphate phosphatase CheZ
MARSHAAVALALCAGLWACAGAGASAEPTTAQSTDQAIQDAREKLKQEVLATEVEPGRTVGALLKEKGMEEELNRQLDEVKPVGGARWLDERSCQVRMELPGERVAEILAKASAGRAGEKQIARETVSRMTFVSVGRSSGYAKKVRSETGRSLVPQQPPEWVNRTISAEAWSRAAKSPLMTAQAAEADARKVLAERVGALTLAYSTTLQHAGEIDPSIAEATERALNSARVRRTDYGADGSAKVRVEINLRGLWDELNR